MTKRLSPGREAEMLEYCEMQRHGYVMVRELLLEFYHHRETLRLSVGVSRVEYKRLLRKREPWLFKGKSE